jgi:hypothetical protein
MLVACQLLTRVQINVWQKHLALNLKNIRLQFGAARNTEKRHHQKLVLILKSQQSLKLFQESNI